MDNTKELTHISLCAGYGGIDIGLKRAIGSIRTIAFSEIEAYAVANLVAKIEKGLLDKAPIWSDLKTFPWGDFYKKVDILSGGFPCQPFSTSGRRGGDEDPRHLFPYIIKGIKQLGRPPIVFFENVEGIISSRIKAKGWSDPINTPVLQHVLRELERLGYKTTAGIFSASEIGAPHQRRRVFILGVHRSPAVNFTKKTNFKPTRFPLPRTEFQYIWEAPRTIIQLGNTNRTPAQNPSDKQKSNLKKIKRRTARMLRNASFKTKLVYSISQGRQRLLFRKNSAYQKKRLSPRSSSFKYIQRIFESKMGRATYGIAFGVDSSKQLTSYDNRIDELRLIGNGVVPDVAKKAFITLFERFTKGQRKVDF